MQIEAGKYYRTRDGRKAFVAAVRTDSPDVYPCVGWVIDDAILQWRLDGVADNASLEIHVDLIAEWVESVKAYLCERRHDGLKYVAIDAPPSYAVGDVILGSAFIEPGKWAEPSDAP